MFKMKTIVVLALSMTMVQALAQTSNSSPYSRYGLGDLNSTGFSSQFAMGGLSLPLSYSTQLNISNPATYSFLKRPVFDFGVQSKTIALVTEDEEQVTNSVALRNVGFGFPVSKRWGLSFGLLPYSSAGYSISSTDYYEAIDGDIRTTYEGNGGVNQFYVGNAFQVINRGDSTILSVGFNASYMFGSVERNRRTVFPENAGFFNTRIRNSMRVSDVTLDAGLHYTGYITDNLKFSAGFSFNIAGELNATQDLLAVSYEPTSFGIEIVKDTIEIQDTVAGSVFLPQKIGYGFAFEVKDQWLFGVEYRSQDWSKYTETFGDIVVADQLARSQDMIFGMRYRNTKIQDLSANASIWNSTIYRAGFRYGKSYLQLGDSQLDEYAVSFGIGVPLARSYSSFNLGIELGQRGTTENGLVQEQIANFYIGLSLSPIEKWFYKRKYD
jgi:long-subunit fatty acid transport protein